jgi:hypothetical protein
MIRFGRAGLCGDWRVSGGADDRRQPTAHGNDQKDGQTTLHLAAKLHERRNEGKRR